MSFPAIPAKTQAARQLLAGSRAALAVPMRMLLINVDGRRSEAELREIAGSLGLAPGAIEELRREGLIASAAAVQAPTEKVQAPVFIAAPAAASSDELRRLMRAKMFAFDLASRMLAGRDTELRDSARAVNSESRFLDWMSNAASRIEAASDAERAQLFRDRVAQAAI